MSAPITTQIEHADQRVRHRYAVCAEGLLRLEAQRVAVARLVAHAHQHAEEDAEAQDAWERFLGYLEDDRQFLDELYLEFQSGQRSAERIIKQVARNPHKPEQLSLLESLESFLEKRERMVTEMFAEEQERLQTYQLVERQLREDSR